jgi:hypothetical protein
MCWTKHSLKPGLIPTISKNREKKSSFLFTQEISHRQVFPVKQKKILHRFFDAASWQGFCNFFCKILIGT